MAIENITKDLMRRFAAPLSEFYNRRIIFWKDPEGEFAETVDELNIPGVKTLKLNGKNNFAAKMLLSETDTESNYLVYDPVSYSDIRDNWLLDIEMYSEEFRADMLSMRMSEFNMESTPAMRKAMKTYSKFFDNKERAAKLSSFKSDYTNERQLHIDILAVLSGASENTVPGVIRAILTDSLNADENKAISNIRKFGNEDVLWDLINRYTGYVHDDGKSPVDLAANILLTALSATMDHSFFAGPENYVSLPNTSNCYSMVNEWLHSDDDAKLFEICRAVEEASGLRERFEKLEVSEMLDSEIFPCINECILGRYLSEISENVVKIDDIINAVEKRRTMKWYKRVHHYYDGILQAAYMQKFYQEHAAGFHIAQYKDMWNKYSEEYFIMDTYYRRFHLSFGSALKQSNIYLADAFKGAADHVEGLYKNWFLKELSSKWTDLVREELEEKTSLTGIPQQKNFYQSSVEPMISSGSRAFVVISDALRYEVASELTETLIRETKGQASLSAMQAVCPSVTKYGMAALLPHKSLEVREDGKVYCDGLSTEGTDNREKVIQAREKDSIAVTYKNLIGMKQAEKRELIAGKNLVYIYHNAIDTIGETMVSEDRVFEACETAITELKNLVRIIINEMNGTNILITADHGFLYSYKPLIVSDKVEVGRAGGGIIEADRRYLIADSKEPSEHLIRMSMRAYNYANYLFVPQGNIRFKTGGGMNYVHGGISLQELMVPVISFKNMRASNKQFVEVSKAKIELISSGRKVSNNMFSLNFYQREPVGGKTAACTYNVFFTDSSGRPVSDVKTIIADKTSSDESERVFRERFTLKGQEFRKTDDYYLNIVEKDGSGIPEKITFTIDIAFANEFDF